MIHTASAASLAALGFLCVSAQAGPLDTIRADARRLFSPPQLTLIFAGVAAGGLATRIDDGLKWELSDGGRAAAALDFVDTYGSTGKTAATAAAIWTLAKWGECGGVKTQSGEAMRSVVAAAFIVAPLKLGTRRRRPDGSDRLSFPSGHTATAFALSTVLARPSRGSHWIAGVRLGIDGSGGADRWKKHHFSDAVAGACIGIAAGRAVGIGGDNPALQARFDPRGWRISWGF